jgi:flagellar biosynthetic protein FlhB
MMAEESFGDKTEAPTPRRLEEARERGQVARSTDLTAALGLLAATTALYLAGGQLSGSLTEMTRQMLRVGDVGPVSAETMMGDFVAVVKHFALILAPVLGGIMAVGIAANVAQGGFVFSTQPLVPSLDKINPVTGFGRIFSKRALARLIGNLIKLTAIVWISYAVIRNDYGRIVALSEMSLGRIVTGGTEIVLSLCFKLAAVLVVIALLDYMYQRWQHLEDLKMTKQELREEMKRMEGDPLIKEHRRHIARQMAMRRMSAEVPKADAVITNPTHFAVAIRYDVKKMAAPQVVAKGQDLMAKRIREIALEHGVTIVEKPPLARALYKTVEVGHEVPTELYKAVAEVLAFVYRLKHRTFNPAA